MPIKPFRLDLKKYVNKLHREEIIETVRTSGDLSDETQAALKTAAETFKTL